MSIVKEYKDASWGIYDDTADLDRAIAISDAYYGDRSSVVQLFKKTEKKVLLQNVDIIYNLDITDASNISMCASDFCIYNDCIWFVHWHLGLLFEVDIESGEILRTIMLPKCERYYEKTFSSICVEDNKIFLTPRFYQDVLIYDIDKEEFKLIPIEQKQDYAYSKGILYNKKLYCLPGSSKQLISIDIKTYEKEYVFDFKKISNVFYSNDVGYNGENVIFTLSDRKGIFKYNLNTGENEIIISDKEDDRYIYSTIAVNNERYYIASDQKNIYSYENDNRFFKKVKLPFNDVLLYTIENDIFIVESCTENKTVIYNKDLEVINEYVWKNKKKQLLLPTLSYGIWKNYKYNKYIYFSNINSEIYIFENGKIINNINLEMQQEIWKHFLEKFYKNKHYEIENDLFSILDL